MTNFGIPIFLIMISCASLIFACYISACAPVGAGSFSDFRCCDRQLEQVLLNGGCHCLFFPVKVGKFE